MLNEKRPLSLTEKLQMLYVDALHVAYSITPKNSPTSFIALGLLEVLVESVKKYNKTNPFSFFKSAPKVVSRFENKNKYHF